MQCVVLCAKGTFRSTTVPTSVDGVPTPKEVATILRRATEPTCVGEWEWKSHQIMLWGYKTGKAGTENQHEIPFLETPLFGDAVVLATLNENGIRQVAPFTTAQYQEFLKQDSDEESEESEEEYESEEEKELEESESESESDSEMSVILEEEEEEEVPVAPKRTKRVNKKTPQWFSLSQMTAESEFTTRMQPMRVEARQQIHAFLGTQLTTNEEDLLEQTLFHHTLEEARRKHVHAVWENKDFGILYDIQVRRVLSNLSKHSYISNTRLETRLKEGEFTLAELASMAFSSLYPEKWTDLFEKEMKREAKMLEVDMSMATDMFRCTKCGKRQCTYYEMQTRSADEPMTIFIRCMNCGKRWRQ